MRLTDEQIGAELRALRRTPEESFAATLARRVSAGFPAVNSRSSGRELTWGRLLPVLGALAAVAVAVVAVVISNGGSGGGGTSAVPSSRPSLAPSGTNASGATTKAAPNEGIAPSEQVVPSPVPPTPLPPTGGRPHNGRAQVQELSASLGLSTDADKLQNAADGVVQVTDRYGGFVDSSTIHAGGSNGHASFALRIPTAHLNDAMTDLSDLGHVTSRDQGSTNVTGAYTDAGKAFTDAQAKVASLLQDLRSASSPSEAAAIRQQLNAARDQLAAARTALRGLKQRVGLTPVSVEITAQGNGSWTIGDAADEAVGVLEAIGGATLIALALLVPLGALIALGWLGTRELRRRRRETALDR
jgi:hypothetical protein